MLTSLSLSSPAAATAMTDDHLNNTDSTQINSKEEFASPKERTAHYRSLIKERLLEDGKSWPAYISAVGNFINGRIGNCEFNLILESLFSNVVSTTCSSSTSSFSSLSSLSISISSSSSSGSSMEALTTVPGQPSLFHLHNQYILAVLEMLALAQAEREERDAAMAAANDGMPPRDRLMAARLTPHHLKLSKQDEQVFGEAISTNRRLQEKAFKGEPSETASDPDQRLMEELCKAEKALGRPLLSRYSLLLPDAAVLKERLMAVCRANNLEEASVTDELVVLMQRSLEEYLSRIIRKLLLSLHGNEDVPALCTADHLRHILALDPNLATLILDYNLAME